MQDRFARPAPPFRVTRRRFLEAGVVLALGLGSAVAVVRTRGYGASPAHKLATLSLWQFVVVQHVARRITAPDRPGDPSIPTADELDVAGFVDGWLVRMQGGVRRDLGRFFAFVEHLAPLRAGFASRFTRLGPAEQDGVLSAIEASSSDLLRAGFDGLKSLILMGFYRDARSWDIVGYDGPLVGRPASGWAPPAGTRDSGGTP